MSNIEHKPDAEDYVWIKSENLSGKHFTVSSSQEYLRPDILKTVGEELFTSLRGLYNTITLPNDSTPERVGTALGSRVGLATEEYEHLQYEDQQPDLQSETSNSNYSDSKLNERWNAFEFDLADKHLLERILQLISALEFPGSRGKLKYVSERVKAVLNRSTRAKHTKGTYAF